MPTSSSRSARSAADAQAHRAPQGKDVPLAWPVPPYPVYDPVEPGVEPQLGEIEGLDGVRTTALVLALMPSAQGIQVRLAHHRAWSTLALSQFLRLTLKQPIRPHDGHDRDVFTEILSYSATLDYFLQLHNGHVVSGKTVGWIEAQPGLFLFTPLDALGTVERVFVPREAYASLRIGEPIGELLVTQRSVTAQQVEQAAQAQQALRRRKVGDYLVDAAVVTPAQLMRALEQQARMPMVLVGEALLRMGFINQQQLDQALERQKIEHELPLGQLLVKMGFLTRDQLNTALACKMGYPMVDALRFPVEPDALSRIPLATARRLMVLPLLARSNLTVVAAADPTRRDMLEELEFVVQGRVTAALADELQIKHAIAMAYGKPPASDPPDEVQPRPHRAANQAPEQSSGELLASMERSEHDLPTMAASRTSMWKRSQAGPRCASASARTGFCRCTWSCRTPTGRPWWHA